MSGTEYKPFVWEFWEDVKHSIYVHELCTIYIRIVAKLMTILTVRETENAMNDNRPVKNDAV